MRTERLLGTDPQHLAGGVEIIVGEYRLAPVGRQLAGKQGAGCLYIVVEQLGIDVAESALVIDLQARIEALHAAGVSLAVVVALTSGRLHAEPDLLAEPLGNSALQLPAVIAAASRLRVQAARIRSSSDHVDQPPDRLVAIQDPRTALDDLDLLDVFQVDAVEIQGRAVRGRVDLAPVDQDHDVRVRGGAKATHVDVRAAAIADTVGDVDTRHATQQLFEIACAAVCNLAAPDQGRGSGHVQAVFGAARAADEYGW